MAHGAGRARLRRRRRVSFQLNDEQAMVFANEDGPAFMAGGFEAIASMSMDEPKDAETFKTGRGLGRHEHCPCLFRGAERFFRQASTPTLSSNWFPPWRASRTG
jgi:hypothetical protein